MTTPSLIDWLRTALDEDERRARKLHASICGHDNVAMDAACDCDWHVGFRLAEVQSKRAILDFYEKTVKGRKEHRDDLALAGALLALHGVVKHLAEPYRSRPGFREEWLDG